MTGEVKTNIETVCEQWRFGGPMNRVNLMRAAAESNGVYENKHYGETYYKGKRARGIYQVQRNDNGQIIKFTQTKMTNPQQSYKEATFFHYNEHGDINQITVDYGDDGTYEYVHDYDCKYDENNQLISREETTWSKIKNAYTSFKTNLKNGM